MKAKFSLLVVLFLLASCNLDRTPTATVQVVETTLLPATDFPPTETAPPSTPEPAPVIEGFPSPYVPFYGVTQVDNLVLRASPGPLFEAKTTLPNASRLLVLGRAPGGEWLFVQTPLERTGWVFGQFVASEGDLNTVPFVQPADLLVVRGRVLDGNGEPVTGIQFAVVQDKPGSPPRTDAVTDATGTFYAFLPANTTGTWAVSFTAIACTSNVMDKDCKCLGGVCGGPTPAGISITLPLEQKEPLVFSWQ